MRWVGSVVLGVMMAVANACSSDTSTNSGRVGEAGASGSEPATASSAGDDGVDETSQVDSGGDGGAGADGLDETSQAGSGGGGGAGADADDAGAAGLGSNTDSGVPLELLEAYCDMEARCIPQCLCDDGGLCGCAAPTRVAECARDVRTWGPLTQGAPCIATFGAWLRCITQFDSCEQVQEFFAAHPDGVTTETPCGTQYLDMDCADFEPLTEYSF